MFLSSRAIAQASATRDYLHTLNQDGETLPAGPVIISPDGLFPSLYRELVRVFNMLMSSADRCNRLTQSPHIAACISLYHAFTVMHCAV